MMKPKLTYFDAPVSRGEECRLALYLAGIDFDDNRVKFADWPGLKDSMPYGSIPVLEMPGQGVLAHSNAILTFIGRPNGLHPRNEFEAARHEGMMAHVEDLRAVIGPTNRLTDAAEKKRAREHIANVVLPAWGAAAERNIAHGPFFGGATLQVVDLKIYVLMTFLLSGKLDHVPPALMEPFVKLRGVAEAVRSDTRVIAWNQRVSKT